MTIHSFTADSLPSGWPFADALRSILDSFSARRTARQRYRALRAELLDYSPQQLAELGISEADVDFIAEDGSRG